MRNKRKKGKRYKIKPRFFIIILLLIFLVFFGISRIASSDGKRPEENILSKASVEKERMAEGIRIMVAAKAYINNKNLVYDPSYFNGGYPPSDDVGVCTDVIWKGFTGIDVELKTLVDRDIAEHPEAYKDVISTPDPNIDFRYVPSLERFFERNSENLSLDLSNPLIWQPGDIVTFESSHVAVVSCLRNLWGEPYIIQHGHDPAADEDRINAADGMELSGHFRW